MKILFLTLLNIDNLNKNGIYHDFVNELIAKGNKVTVVSAIEKRFGGKTKYIKNNENSSILNVSIGDITKTSLIKKGINIISIERKYLKEITKYLKDEEYDLIIYTTPPITFNKLVKRLKRKYIAKTYLLLKDIFPQNAVDLNLFKKNGLIYNYFRYKEKKLYEISDYMGAMSKTNIDFITSRNKVDIKPQIIRNALYELDYNIDEERKIFLYNKFGLDSQKRLFLYGGNLGIPQGIEFIKKVMSRFNEVENGQLLIVGSGTHYSEIEEHSLQIKDNVKVINALPKEEYDQLISLCDIGLIFLDNRFTIPNYPSRLTSLLNASKPILMATDINTDIKDDIVNNKCGYWSQSNDVDGFILNAIKLSEMDLSEFQNNSYKLFKKEFLIEDNVKRLLDMVQ